MNRTALTGDGAAWGYIAAFSRDTLGRLTGTTESGYSTSSLAYDQAGRRSSLGLGFNGTSSADSYGYDSVGRLTSLGHDLSGTSYDQSLGFSYNPASQIKQNTRSNDAYAWTGHYNVNRNYTSNGLNQYTASGSATLSYDANGNLTSDGSTSYVYDDENRLVSASGGHSASLAYDPLGRLWQVSSTSTGTTRFYYDGGHIAIEGDSSGNVLRAYVHGEGADSPMIWYEAVSGGTSRRFLHRDERGSITAVGDQSGNEFAVNAYDEYGIPNSGNLGRFGYTGQAWIGELGMWYYKARIYSPTLGRFMQTDPAGYGDGMNWYGYVKSDPIKRADPSGLLEVGNNDEELDDLLAGGKKKPRAPDPCKNRGSRGECYDPFFDNSKEPTMISCGFQAWICQRIPERQYCEMAKTRLAFFVGPAAAATAASGLKGAWKLGAETRFSAGLGVVQALVAGEAFADWLDVQMYCH